MRKKFNIIDGIILVVILAVIAAACFIYFNMNRNNEKTATQNNTVTLDFIVEVTNLEKDTAEFFRSAEGQGASFGKTSTGAGQIIKVEVVPYKKNIEDLENGKINPVEIPDKYNVKITIRSEVAKTDTSYTSNDEVIAVGKLMPFNSNGVASENSYIIDLLEVK